MSFSAELKLYRPTPPPRITADDLARFVGRIRETDALSDSGLLGVQTKFGTSVDGDDKLSHWVEMRNSCSGVIGEIDWDIDEQCKSIQQIVGVLSGDARTIYRASIHLGTPVDEVLRPITRTNSPENEIDFYPDTLSIEVGPVEIYSFEERLHVGWVSVGIGGGGYLFPWSLAEVVRKLESTPKIARIAETCRTFWPIAPSAPERRIVKLRKQFTPLWPYPEFDKPWDWFWGVAEG